jgi:hypothetical protein
MEALKEIPKQLPKKGVDFVTHSFDIGVPHLTKLREMVFTMKKNGQVFYTQKKALGFAIELMYREMAKHYTIEELPNEVIMEIQQRSELIKAGRKKKKDEQEESPAPKPAAPTRPSFEPEIAV